MKRNFKKLTALAAVTMSMVTPPPMNVSAAGVEDVFDAAYYADSYADLKAAFGYDENALLTHYLTFGLNEGRCASTVFDAAAYRNAYADLDAAFGDNWDAYVDHYYTVGMAEGRTAGVLDGSASGVPAGNPAAEQPAPVQPSGSDIVTDSVVHGVYCFDDVPVNVAITYSDVVTWPNGDLSHAQPPEGCEWQRFTITVTTDGTPVSPSILESHIDMDYNDPNIDVTYNGWVDDQRLYQFNLNYNGKTYEDCEANLYCYYYWKDTVTELTVEFEAMMPKGYLLPTAVYLDYDTIIRH